MGIDDSFAETYFFGTADEIKAYRTKDEESFRQFNASFVAIGAVGLLGLPYTLPLAADTLCRVGYSYFKSEYVPDGVMERMSHSPGIVGLVRQAFEEK